MINISLFNSEDTKLDYVLKISTLVIVFCLFMDTFFGYWIGLDSELFQKQVNSWPLFVITTIFFYVSIEILMFVTFVAVYRHYSIILKINGYITIALFGFGLFHVGLRENVFCFILLLPASLQFILLGHYYDSIEKCQLRQHGFDCRGQCVRQEWLKWLDNYFGGHLHTMCPSAFQHKDGETSGGGSKHVQFHNSIEQPEPPMEETSQNQKTLAAESSIPETIPQEQTNKVKTIDELVSIDTSDMDDILMTSQSSATSARSLRGHGRQPSQSNQQLQHLNPSSFLQNL